MEMAVEELAGGITKVAFSGRFDIAGAEAVDLKMNVIAGNSMLLVIDMQKVSFLGSMGLRTLVSAARAVKNREPSLLTTTNLPATEVLNNCARSSSRTTSLPDLPSVT